MTTAAAPVFLSMPQLVERYAGGMEQGAVVRARPAGGWSRIRSYPAVAPRRPPGCGLGNRDQAAGGARLVCDDAGVHQRGRDRVSGGEPEARRITAAYTLRSSTPLDFTFSGWVEGTNASFESTMVGFTAPRGHKPRMDTNGKRSRDMAAAVGLAVAVFHRGPWRLAVRDVHNAYMAATNRSDDAFVFAARAIEDLAWATSTTGKKSYADLNRHLGTTKVAFLRRTKALRGARNAVIHGDENNPDVIAARLRMPALIRQSQRIIREAITASKELPAI